MDCKWVDQTTGAILADTHDPFWNDLCDGNILARDFDTKMLEHLELTNHPKAEAFLKLAHNLTEESYDLGEVYLTALQLMILL